MEQGDAMVAAKSAMNVSGGKIMRDNRIVPVFLLSGLARRLPTLALLLAGLLMLPPAATVLAAGGDIIWQSADSQSGKQQATASAYDSAGNVIVAGYRNLSGVPNEVYTNDDYYTVKFKADGSGVLWRAAYDNIIGSVQIKGSDKINDVTVDSNDDVIVTGTVWNGVNLDIYTVKYCGTTGSPSCSGKIGGEVIWAQTFNGSANGNDAGTVVSVDQVNNVYVGGYSQNSAGK
jgi:hypothetical protein